MRTVYVISLLLIFAANFCLAQQTIQLQLKPGYEYVFQKADSEYFLVEEDQVKNEKRKIRGYKIKVDSINLDHTLHVSLSFLEHYKEGQSGNRYLIDREDFIYPDFRWEKNFITRIRDI